MRRNECGGCRRRLQGKDAGAGCRGRMQEEDAGGGRREKEARYKSRTFTRGEEKRGPEEEVGGLIPRPFCVQRHVLVP